MKEEKLPKLIGLNIKKIRMRLKLTQQGLADLCEFEKSNMCRIEAGKTNCTIETLYKISQALGVTLSKLVDVEKEMKNNKDRPHDNFQV